MLIRYTVILILSTQVVIIASLCCSTAARQQLLQTTKEARIIGGSPVDKGGYPEFVLLRFRKVDADGYVTIATCGGTLLRKHLVLTAAHCAPYLVNGSEVVLGIAAYKGNIRRDEDGEFSADDESKAKVWIPHPKYLEEDGNDVGIVVLEKPLSGPTVKLPEVVLQEDELSVGSTVTVVGFGRNNDYMIPSSGAVSMEEGGRPPVLYEVNLTVGEAGILPCPEADVGDVAQRFTPSKEYCYYGDEFYTTLDENYHLNGGIGIKNDCDGDSGGPSFQNGIQYGLVSRGGEGLCKYTFRSPYSIHTRVSSKLVSEFIQTVMEMYQK